MSFNKEIGAERAMANGTAPMNFKKHEDALRRFEQFKVERLYTRPKANLYIKNLDDTIDDERLISEFRPFGKITSAKVMMEEGRSRGFGFVSYSSSQAASRAVLEMNGRILGTKPLYVTFAQKKAERREFITAQYLQQKSNQKMGQLEPTSQPGMSTSTFNIPTLAQPQCFNGAAQMTTPHWSIWNSIQPDLQASGNACSNSQTMYTAAPPPPNRLSFMPDNVKIPKTVWEPVAERRTTGRLLRGQSTMLNTPTQDVDVPTKSEEVPPKFEEKLLNTEDW